MCRVWEFKFIDITFWLTISFELCNTHRLNFFPIYTYFNSHPFGSTPNHLNIWMVWSYRDVNVRKTAKITLHSVHFGITFSQLFAYSFRNFFSRFIWFISQYGFSILMLIFFINKLVSLLCITYVHNAKVCVIWTHGVVKLD